MHSLLQRILEEAELAECTLSFGNGDTSTRKDTGSYYTPIDVTHFFWNEFFAVKEINDLKSATKFCRDNHFVEPAVGAGVLFFGLLYKLSSLGVDEKTLSRIQVSLVDINKPALGFIKGRLNTLELETGVTFSNVLYLHDNFLDLNWPSADMPYCIFGNPPFVSNEKGTSNWKNTYADFLEKALELASSTGHVHMIVPLSLTFSRDYIHLRDLCKQSGKTIQISNFDNIPDSLFKAGKPESTNTNNANSQRCSIISLIPSTTVKVLVSPLMRWFKIERENLLSQSPSYLDITSYGFDDQIPRPSSGDIIDYLTLSADCPRLGDYLRSSGFYNLQIGSVARNYVSIRSESSTANHTLIFKNESDFILIFAILASDLFLEYWKTLGDGFHVTKKNLYQFPIHPGLIEEVSLNFKRYKKLWATRDQFRKSKLNAAKTIVSYDFRGQVQFNGLLDVITRVQAAE